jgi:hypothetical protein
MLKTYTYVFTSSAIYQHVYVDATYGNTCAIYVIYYTFPISAKRIQNAKVQRTHVETMCIPVWITPFQTC